MSVYKSIAKNFAASTFGLGVNFLSQIAVVPLFISFWGIYKYADWILITSLSTIFMMSDLGLNRASNNEFVIKFHKKEYDTCSKLQTNGFLFILLVYFALLITSLIILKIWGFKEILGVKQFTENETSVGFILLLTDVFVIMFGRVYHGIFRATSRTHVVIIVDNLTRLACLMVIIGGIYFNIGIINMLILYIIPDLFGVFYKKFGSRKYFTSRLSLSNFDSGVFKSIIKPSLAFMLFPLGQAVSSQGLVFAINIFLGGSALVAFTTTRTIVNFLRQVVNMLSTSINPEICAAFGRNDYKTILNVYNKSLVITFLMTIGCIIFLIVTGKFIYSEWTKNAIPFNYSFFIGMLFVLLISCLSGLSSVIPLSTNTHVRFTTAFLLSQAGGVSICIIFLNSYPNLNIIPFTLSVTEFILFIYILKENNNFFGIRFSEMFDGIWEQTKYILQKGRQYSMISFLKCNRRY
jgi:O-antigen/teichoic acid export membrane protein